MKSKKIIFCAALSALSIQAMSPDLILNNMGSLSQTTNRAPANILKEDKKVFSNTQSTIGKESPKNSDDGLKDKVESEKDEKIILPAQKVAQEAICKAESKGEKLEAEIKSLLEDKESVLKAITLLKKEQEKLQEKIVKKDAVEPIIQNNNSELSNSLQMQMMNMFYQMQSSFMMQMNPYSSLYPQYPGEFANNSFLPQMNSPYYSSYSFAPQIDRPQLRLGLMSPTPNYSSPSFGPYSEIPNLNTQNSFPIYEQPNLERQLMNSPAQFRFPSSQMQPANGFDFRQKS